MKLLFLAILILAILFFVGPLVIRVWAYSLGTGLLDALCRNIKQEVQNGKKEK